MKYNPKVDEDMAALPGFTQLHPLQPVETVQGALEALHVLGRELGEIFGRVLTTDAEITACAAMLQARGARNVLVSMAGDGALLLDEHGVTHRMGVPKGKVLNSVGAGDSMVAGFLAGYLQKGDYDWALKLGTAAGSATAFSLGLATREKIDELLATL